MRELAEKTVVVIHGHLQLLSESLDLVLVLLLVSQSLFKSFLKFVDSLVLRCSGIRSDDFGWAERSISNFFLLLSEGCQFSTILLQTLSMPNFSITQ